MAIFNVAFTSFNAGELGPYMSSRTDLDYYRSSAKQIENLVVLPQGGVQKRRGFAYIDNISALDASVEYDKTTLVRFNFRRDQQYVLLFRDNYIDIYRDDQTAKTIETGIPASEIETIRTAQSGDSMFIVAHNVGVFKLTRQGSHTDWTWEDARGLIEDDYYNYNVDQTMSVNPTSGGSGRTFTLSGTTAYWTANHANNIKIAEKAAAGRGTLTGFQNDATGGTAYSSAGTASYAFDGNASNVCSAGANGWIGYGWGAATTIRIVGIKGQTTETATIVFETDDNSSFTTPTEIGSTDVSLTDGEWLYVDVPRHTGETHFRIRATSGNLNVRDLVFNKGLVATGTVETAFTTTGHQWFEQAFSSAKGWPRTVTFLNERLWFGGTRDAPAAMLASKSGDIYSFNTGSADAADGIAFTIASDQSLVIRDLRAKRNGLVVLTSEGEWQIAGSDSSGISPTTVVAKAQSEYGITNVPIAEVDGSIMFNTGSGKQIRSFQYDYASDQYKAANLTDLAHHIFTEDALPTCLTLLRSYRDTQSNALFVTRSNGDLAVCVLDIAKSIIAWSRWTTNGKFGSTVVCESPDLDGVRKPHLYAVVQRPQGSSLVTYLEKLTEKDIFLDSWVYGDAEEAQADWTGAEHLADETVSCVGDGFVMNDVTVNGSGEFTLESDVSTIAVGYGYTGKLETQAITPFTNQGALKGPRIIPKVAYVDVENAYHLRINGARLLFRRYDVATFGGALEPFTGTRKINLVSGPSNVTRDPTITITMEEPLPCTLLGLNVYVIAGGRG